MFRYPVLAREMPADVCPRCGGGTRLAHERWLHQEAEGAPVKLPGPTVLALLDNVRSVFNVGSVFRIADGAGVSHVHLAGITPTPDHPKMRKTALGAENVIPWTYHANSLRAARALREAGCRLWALEGDHPHAVSLFLPAVTDSRPIVLIAGSELTGVDLELLALCERILTIPMQGQKRSLNVAVAFGIAAYELRRGPAPPIAANQV
ncbi:MAG: hypothetical protein KC418_23035 [Anaerolineales bacterium]|nr:hypothetical protein [Anaerolineales bacterium]MCB8950586.1 TrmH family RNA methyltransferase [Ardenticatenales bacterium]